MESNSGVLLLTNYVQVGGVFSSLNDTKRTITSNPMVNSDLLEIDRPGFQ